MSDNDLIAMARLAQRDDRMSTGALYGDLADRIEALQKALKDQSSVSDRLAEQLAAARQDADEAEAYAEELEAKLATCEKYRDAYAEFDRIGTQAYRDLEEKLQNQTDLIKQFFALLETTEETDEGRVFHPTTIRSCRVIHTQKLEEILGKLKGTIND